MEKHTIRIATRESDLALWQARHVQSLLEQQPDVIGVDLVPMTTRGDQILDRALNKVGGKGLFIKELEVAMLEDRADIAVHSMKDVPATMPDGFAIAAVLDRADPRDALVGSTLDALPKGARVGTSSLRRAAQLRLTRPDLEILPLRGNVNTRLAKLDAGDYDAIVLACAGLQRLGMAERIAEPLAVDLMLPAVGQGIVGIECRSDQPALRSLLGHLNDANAVAAATAERSVARALEATCHSPLGVHATINDGALTLDALLASPDGSRVIREQGTAPAGRGDKLGRAVAGRMLDAGAAELIAEAD
ncbi:MAG: hydroxymethylbilane synthase [Pseudomonadota bacterium]